MSSSTISLAVNTKIIQQIAGLSERYRIENLSAPYLQKDSLERDWWSGLRLFLNHSFFQGRRDEVSEKVEDAAMPVLQKNFARLAPEQLEMMDFVAVDAELQEKIGKGKIGKKRDVEMLVGIFRFIAALEQKNLTLYSLTKLRGGKVKYHYKELQNIRQIGPKVASFYLRDLACIYELEDQVKSTDLQFFQPIDGWVRKVAHRLEIIAAENCSDDEARSQIIRACSECGVSPFKFNQGAWYLGKNAFEILIEQLDKIDISQKSGRVPVKGELES